ncbi:MAG: peptidylprolyl isomerase, partial [Bdellovibrionales bacterium]|nr:peptidylprolyl isomerase [Bdellovibrionales bacterium]
NKIRTAIIYTNRGNLQFKLFPEEAPWHVSNFKYRADKGYYRGTTFHIFYQDYIIQGGGPQRNPVYSAPYTLPAEFNEHQHLKGALGMARKPDYANPERRSSGNQFHILLGDTPRMDGSFTVFGMIERGSELLSKLGKGDQIIDIKVFVRPE